MAESEHISREDTQDGAGLDTRGVTWAALLARWVQFARSAVALPDHAEGRRLRDAVPDLIMLQAVYFALTDLDGLTPDERALGLDRAQVLIDKHADVLGGRWADGDLPPQVVELIDDARRQLLQAAGMAEGGSSSPSPGGQSG